MEQTGSGERVLKCAGCHGAMQRMEDEPGLHRCTWCGAAFVEGLLSRRHGVPLPKGIARELPDQPRSCPGCGEEMEQLRHAGVEVDVCSDCNAIHFDENELRDFRTACRRQNDAPGCDRCGKQLPFNALRVVVDEMVCEACRVGLLQEARRQEIVRDGRFSDPNRRLPSIHEGESAEGGSLSLGLGEALVRSINLIDAAALFVSFFD